MRRAAVLLLMSLTLPGCDALGDSWKAHPLAFAAPSWLCTVSRPLAPGDDPCDPKAPREFGTEKVETALDATQAAIKAAQQHALKFPVAPGESPWGCRPENCRAEPIGGISTPPPGGCGCGLAGDVCDTTAPCCVGLNCALDVCD